MLSSDRFGTQRLMAGCNATTPHVYNI